MSPYRRSLPQLADRNFITDGGLETTLIYHDGIDLPHFAAFVLLDRPGGENILHRYFSRYAEIGRAERVGVVLESATWRAFILSPKASSSPTEMSVATWATSVKSRSRNRPTREDRAALAPVLLCDLGVHSRTRGRAGEAAATQILPRLPLDDPRPPGVTV